MKKISLTRRQQEIYDYLREHEDRLEYPPTIEELCQAMGVSSRGSMHKHIQALIEAGLVEPSHGRQRGIRLRHAAEDSLPDADEDQLPFLGYIAAGRPIEALPTPEPLAVPAWLHSSRPCYVLQVKGDSMIDEGILDGDWVIIEKRDQARDGEIVVALVDSAEATLKRIEQKPGRVILHPANAAMTAMEYPPDAVQIQGVLLGQMRSYQ